MERKVFLGVLAFTIIVLAIAILAPGREHNRRVDLPWQITATPDGSIQVFGLTLGKSSLNDAQTKFVDPAIVSLFSNNKGEMVVEAYFEQVKLSGLKAKVVLVLDIPKETLTEIYEGGARISTIGSGEKKVTPAPEDMKILLQMPIGSLTYMPRASLDDELLEKRFGSPARKISEGEQVHWLYPEKGLDISINESGKAVFQYLAPRDFEQVSQPLLELIPKTTDVGTSE